MIAHYQLFQSWRALRGSKLHYMAISSINIQPAKLSSESHNKREVSLDYVKDDLTHRNESWSEDSISSRRKFIEERCKEMTGRKLQKNATPIREGVLIFEDHHKMKDMLQVKDALQEKYGIKTFQIYMHKDEGHNDQNGKWKANLHAHFVFDWSDEKTGKMLRIGRAEMSDIQSTVANVLKMERGKETSKRHLSAMEFKIQKKNENLKEFKKLQHLSKKEAEQLIHKNLLGVIDKEKTIDNLSNLIQGFRADIQTQNSKIESSFREHNHKIKSLKSELEIKELENSKLKKMYTQAREYLFKKPLNEISKLRTIQVQKQKENNQNKGGNPIKNQNKNKGLKL